MPATSAPSAQDAKTPAALNWRRFFKGAAQFAFCFGVIPNLPFLLLARTEGITTPGWFSLDGLLLGILALFVRPVWVLVLFFGDFLLDIVYSIRATYGPNYTDILLSVRYLFTAIAGDQLLWITLLIALVLGTTALAWIFLRPRLAGQERVLLIALVLAVAAPWTVLAQNARSAAARERQTDSQLGYVRNTSAYASYSAAWASSLRSPTLAFYHAWKREKMWAWLHGRPVQPLISTVSAADHAAPILATQRWNFVLVLVESWGEAVEPPLRQALLAPFTTLDSGYKLETGTTPFHGQTGDGELRETCDRKFAGPGVAAAVAPESLSACLGWQFAHRGYATTAMDSAADFWPGGENWYRLMGFQRIVDYHILHDQGMPEFIAGTFRSIPDQDAAAQLPHLLTAGAAPHFIFFLTVSAHLPVHLPLPASGYNADCTIAATTRNSAAACGWFRIETTTLTAIARAAATPGLPPTVFLAVGDHRPPFVDSTLEDFSPTEVPYVLLVPRPHPQQ